MKRFLLLASLAAVAVGGVAAIPAEAGAAKVKCKGKEKAGNKVVVKCPKNKLRGPRGPIGPQGPKGDPGTGTGSGGGATKIFFAANGVAPNTTVYNAGGLNFQVGCTGGGISALEFRSTNDNAVMRLTRAATDGTQNDADSIDGFEGAGAARDDLDVGEVISFNGDDELIDWVYTAPNGTVSTGQLLAESGNNSTFNGSNDCLVAGTAETV